MRAERLAWTDKPVAAISGRRESDRAQTPPAKMTRRRRLLHREGVRAITRVLDIVGVILITVGLCIAAGLDIWASPMAAALPFFAMPACGVAGVWLMGGYRFRYAEPLHAHLVRVIAGATAGTALVALMASAGQASHAALLWNLCAAISLALFSLHANYLGLVRAATRKGLLSDNVVIVGATRAAGQIISRNVRERELNILGYFDDRAIRTAATMMGDAPHLGCVDDLLGWDGLPEVDRVVITVTSTAQARVRDLIDRLRNLPQEIILVLDLDGFNPEQTSLARVVDAPAAYVSGAPRDIQRAAIKRLFDLLVASSSLVLLAIPMAVIALMIKLDSKGPVLFRQKRHGFNNEIIRVWKFRTMRQENDAETRQAEDGIIRQTQPDDPRVTRIGRFLRISSLDELPQLLNVLASEMSIVGPRPHAVGMTAGSIEVTRTVGDYAHRHRMKPGMTGWAQINGSRGPCDTAEEVRERVRLDLEYVNRASVWLDAYIVLMTVPRLLGDGRRRR